MLNYATSKEAEADCGVMRTLFRVLDAPKRSLRRDECGTWYIKGRKGHAYSWGPSGGWLLYCDAGTARKGSSIKRRLSFCKVTQDSDTDGCLRLFQATALRKALGLRRKPTAVAASFPSIKLTSAKKGVSRAPAGERGKGGVTIHCEAPAQKSRQNPQIEQPEVAQLRFRQPSGWGRALMDRRYFMAANMVALRHDRRRLDKSVRSVLGAVGMRS